jgi:hypothetical protein
MNNEWLSGANSPSTMCQQQAYVALRAKFLMPAPMQERNTV